jgi:hypothetical protein
VILPPLVFPARSYGQLPKSQPLNRHLDKKSTTAFWLLHVLVVF